MRSRILLLISTSMMLRVLPKNLASVSRNKRGAHGRFGSQTPMATVGESAVLGQLPEGASVLTRVGFIVRRTNGEDRACPGD